MPVKSDKIVIHSGENYDINHVGFAGGRVLIASLDS